MTRREAADAERGFTLLEVLVVLAILGYAVTGLIATVGRFTDVAVVTKVNRQMRQLVEYQMGQIAVGKLHPDEEDPFPDGQTGAFLDVGGYPEEYEAFTWEIRREEVPICGTNDADLADAGFEQTSDGFVRRQTDDILAGLDEHLEKPEGQFKSRVTLTVRWHGPSAEDDRVFTIVTLLPVNGEEEQDVGGGEEPGVGGAAGDGTQQDQSKVGSTVMEIGAGRDGGGEKR
jgi:prepilin-type N-terminal cleavage/methylation domain-containing protein